MTHTLEGREALQAAAMGAIRSSSGAPEAVHLRRVRANGDRPSGHETGPTPGGPRTSSRTPITAIVSQEERPVAALADGQVDRLRGTGCERDGDHHAALAGDHQRAVPALDAQGLDVGT